MLNWHTLGFLNVCFSRRAKFRSSRLCKSNFLCYPVSETSGSLIWSMILAWAPLLYLFLFFFKHYLSRNVAKCLSSKELTILQSNAVVRITLCEGRQLLKPIITRRHKVFWLSGVVLKTAEKYKLQNIDFLWII